MSERHQPTSTSSAATFVFADIAGFTALTEAHGDEHAVALVEEFAETVARELPPGGTHVKTIGDAVLVRIPGPADAVTFALRLSRRMLERDRGSAVRVGLHHGTAIERDGDYFGSAVNLAARVTSIAAAGDVLVTGSTAALAPEVDGVLYESRGRHSFHNVREPIEIFAAVPLGRSSAPPLAIDPVCQMAVDPDQAPGRVLHDGEAYFFCSLDCTASFAQAPEKYTKRRARA